MVQSVLISSLESGLLLFTRSFHHASAKASASSNRDVMQIASLLFALRKVSSALAETSSSPSSADESEREEKKGDFQYFQRGSEYIGSLDVCIGTEHVLLSIIGDARSLSKSCLQTVLRFVVEELPGIFPLIHAEKKQFREQLDRIVGRSLVAFHSALEACYASSSLAVKFISSLAAVDFKSTAPNDAPLKTTTDNNSHATKKKEEKPSSSFLCCFSAQAVVSDSYQAQRTDVAEARDVAHTAVSSSEQRTSERVVLILDNVGRRLQEDLYFASINCWKAWQETTASDVDSRKTRLLHALWDCQYVSVEYEAQSRSFVCKDSTLQRRPTDNIIREFEEDDDIEIVSLDDNSSGKPKQQHNRVTNHEGESISLHTQSYLLWSDFALCLFDWSAKDDLHAEVLRELRDLLCLMKWCYQQQISIPAFCFEKDLR